MLKIRLQRVGKKHDPSFRVVLTDSKNSTKSGRFLEILGSYDARKGEPRLEAEKIKYWISKGAQPTETLHNLLVDAKIVSAPKKNVLRRVITGVKAPEAAAEAAPVSTETASAAA